jgi:hypothetical protein
MKTFDEYWEQYGELHASMCGRDIKQFAKEIWESAIGNMEPKWKAHLKLVKELKDGNK